MLYRGCTSSEAVPEEAVQDKEMGTQTNDSTKEQTKKQT